MLRGPSGLPWRFSLQLYSDNHSRNREKSKTNLAPSAISFPFAAF